MHAYALTDRETDGQTDIQYLTYIHGLPCSIHTYMGTRMHVCHVAETGEGVCVLQNVID